MCGCGRNNLQLDLVNHGDIIFGAIGKPCNAFFGLDG